MVAAELKSSSLLPVSKKSEYWNFKMLTHKHETPGLCVGFGFVLGILLTRMVCLYLSEQRALPFMGLDLEWHSSGGVLHPPLTVPSLNGHVGCIKPCAAPFLWSSRGPALRSF